MNTKFEGITSADLGKGRLAYKVYEFDGNGIPELRQTKVHFPELSIVVTIDPDGVVGSWSLKHWSCDFQELVSTWRHKEGKKLSRLNASRVAVALLKAQKIVAPIETNLYKYT